MDVDKMSVEELKEKLKEYIKKEQLLMVKQKEATKRYYKTDKGKQKLKVSQKKYYLKNREKILARYKEKKELLNKTNQDGTKIIDLLNNK
jgi:hypothetical protein